MSQQPNSAPKYRKPANAQDEMDDGTLRDQHQDSIDGWDVVYDPEYLKARAVRLKARGIGEAEPVKKAG